MFKLHAKEIEEMIGSKLEWREATKATRIITLHSYNITNEKQWEQATEWLLNKALLFKQIAKHFDK